MKRAPMGDQKTGLGEETAVYHLYLLSTNNLQAETGPLSARYAQVAEGT